MHTRLLSKDWTLRRFNNGLSLLVVLLAAYILLWPLLPEIRWWLKHDAPIVSSSPSANVPVEPIPSENTLVIPRMDLRQPILDGSGIDTVNRGIWRRPLTSTPSELGNTVLVGHRFTYQGASIFYHLDKLALGDNILIYWQGKAYNYKVSTIKIVFPNDANVEASTAERQLTLYTCTPLWTSAQRLVVIATPTDTGMPRWKSGIELFCWLFC